MKSKYSTSIMFLVILLAFSVTFASDGKSDWPQWRGINQDGKGLDTDVFKDGYGLKISWKKPLGSGYSSISIAEGHAVTMFSDSTFDYVVSLNAESGTEQWRVKIDSTYIGHTGSHNGPISTPIINDGKVYALGPKGNLLAVDLKTGKKVWSKHIENDHGAVEPFYGFSTSPVISGNVFIVETGGINSTISGFNKNTGELLWATGSDTVQYQNPVVIEIDGEPQVVCAGNKYLYGLNPESGKKLWEYYHNGQWRSVSPVPIESNKLFVNYSQREAMLLSIKKDADKYAVEEVWKSRESVRTYNTSIYHDGFIYGYTRNFINCIDANTGELKWKSRPPGAGLMILVDGHLVIVNQRQGSIHVAKASAEGYQEIASLDVLDGLTWSPPSFANGRIYARNLTNIAAIDIVPVDQPLATADVETEKQMWLPDTKFGKWITKVEKSDNKQKLIDYFLAKQESFPIIEDKKYAHIIYNGKVADLVIMGDLLDFGVTQQMNRIEGTDFYYASFEVESDARRNYAFQIFDNNITDPLNPYKAPGGPLLQFEVSELRMPDVAVPTHFNMPAENVARGTIETFEVESKILNNKRNVHVYLPAGYTNGNSRYPVLFVNYGLGAKDNALIPNTIDNMVAKNRIQPIIAVFVEAPQSFREYSRALRDQHAQMYAEELLPLIDKKYRTMANADSRLLIGGDEGGFAAFYAAFKYPDLFHNIAGQSTHFHKPDGGDVLTAMVSESEKLPLNIYMDWGKRDLIYPNGLSWVALNEEFITLLKKKGYSVTGGEVNDTFGWASWRNRTDKILETFFPMKKTQK